MKFQVLLPAILAGLFTVVGQAPSQQLVIRDSEAASHVGETVTVEGTVASVHVTRSRTTFLNFGAAYPKQTFTAVVFSSAASQFPNPQQWDGKRVRVTGKVRLYRDRPEIVLEASSQLATPP
jgi:DNA/RNA endonuclease YhcR with UshA esterase domain